MENHDLPIVRNLENVFLIDWFEVTLHGCHVDEVQRILGLTHVEWETVHSFQNGYPVITRFGHISIRWGADDERFYTDSFKDGIFRSAASKVRQDMGISLAMSGQGCREFEEFSGLSWFELLENIFRFGGRVHFTRLDLAYDDHSGLLDISHMRRDVEDRNYRGKAKKATVIWSDDQMNDIQGTTLQIGSKSSPVLIRIYDKAAERGYGRERHWIRVELQLRDDRAHEAAKLLFQRESIGIVASGIIRNYCCFVVPTADSNKSRWPVAEYWLRVLEGMEKIRVWCSPGTEYNLMKMKNHLVYQYGQSLIAIPGWHGSVSAHCCSRCSRHCLLPQRKIRWLKEILMFLPPPPMT